MKYLSGGFMADLLVALRKALKVATLATILAAGGAESASASTWAGGSSDWSNNTPPTGWNGTGMPNAIGAIADNPITTSGTTIQNVAPGVTVGTLSLSGSGDFSWSHTLTNPITLNQDGAGAGFATISNSNSSTGAINSLILGGAGTLTLADDLLVANTGGSTNPLASIQISSTIGGAGNLTLRSDSTSLLGGFILFDTGVNTFTGNVLVQKGITTIRVSTSLGAATNAVTLGQSGQGGAALITTTNAADPAYPITVAAGAGGTLALGTTTTSSTSGGSVFSGPITLNGNVSLQALGSAGTATFSGIISGNGGVSIDSAATGIVAISALNTYAGDTVINSGVLLSTNSVPDGPGKGNLFVNTGATFSLGTSNDAVNGLSGAGTVTSTSGTRTITVGGNDQSSLFTGRFTNGTGGLAKTGSGTFTLRPTAVSTFTGSLNVNYNNGKVQLDFANMATPTNIINSAAPLLVRGGTLEIVGKSAAATSQTFASYTSTITAGTDSQILLTPQGGGSVTLTITSPTISARPVGATLDFSVGGTGTGTFAWTTGNVPTTAGAWATFNRNNWAVSNGTNI